MKISSIEPSCPTLKSLKHEDIIDCILESIVEIDYHRCEEDPDFGNWDQRSFGQSLIND